MKTEDKTLLIYSGIFHALIFLLLLFFSKNGFFSSLISACEVFLAFFLPGFILVLLFFRNRSLAEKALLSFALSFSLLPIIVFYLNYVAHVRVSAFSFFLSLILLVGLGIGGKLLFLQSKKK
ncbi:hypothetical protein H6501_04260 [Candidatus Woesearchaeota archaeon]|nr:hypothetical protein [Nanoarchaeota archaeon]MCB9370786.1 hypothetical protein [Candidatus Woesearchaeota archaeon]USN43887.1 MAG: hypothetical protein H6500_05860 [Candidatus Woesearchaeota archaeon]